MRRSIAEKKAELCFQMRDVMFKLPYNVRNGSIKTVRQWSMLQLAAHSVYANPRSSLRELNIYLQLMKSFAKPRLLSFEETEKEWLGVVEKQA